MMHKPKYSDRFVEDFEFYLRHREKFMFCGQEIPEFPFAPGGATAKEAFYRLDTHGVRIPCREPQLLWLVVRCKKAINWQIKVWVEGFDDMFEPISYYMAEFVEPPAWVEKAFRNQLAKESCLRKREF